MSLHEHDNPMNELKILIVDDIRENIELLKEFLSDYGYTILSAKNGLEALEKLQEEQVHLIIADAMMPKMDGFQLCKKVKDDPTHAAVPFFIYTGDYIDKEDREFAKSIGVDKYMVKSEGWDELITSVNEVARNRYGYNRNDEGRKQDTIDESAFLEQHHGILIKKLEEKMQHLELYTATLNRKNIEIKSSEARYRSLFEHANIGIVILDRETKRILDANHQAVDLFGYSREELLEMDCLPIEVDKRNTSQLLYTELFFNGEASIVNKENESIEVQLNSVPISHAQDPRIIVYIRDLSEHVRIQKKLLQIENMTLMGRLAAGIAHEIRNPLAAVTVNLQYLQKKYADNEDILNTVEMAMEGSKRVEQVIEKTLSLARATPPRVKAQDVHEIIDRVLWFMKLPLKQKNVGIEKEYSLRLPPISVDDKQIQQVLLNVLQNAVDASDQNSSIIMKTYASDEENAQKICVEVSDSGPGIPPEMQKNMFEPFNTTKKGGTGLGLAISKYIMDRHNADIEVSSQEGKGTTICLKFPSHATMNGDT